MKNSIMFVAFHYPPVQMSSGVHRTVAFSRYLAEQDWDVSVLTVSASTYEQTNNLAAELIPKNIQVIRCKAWDTARDLAFQGRYFSWMAQPDRWVSWLPTALIKGKWHLKPNQLILSTYPIATAHIIGYVLHKLSGNPWIVDLRDPMLQQDYPLDPIRRKIFQWIERKIMDHASFVMLTSPGAINYYKQRYPEKASDFWRLLPNGYDEKIFEGLTQNCVYKKNARMTLLHSGTIYPQERDPTSFFCALKYLNDKNISFASKIRVVLRATGNDSIFQTLIEQYGLTEIVELKPPIDYRSAAQEILNADGLVLMQSASCNYQTPAKAYEYIRAKRPILVLAPLESDTCRLVQKSNVAFQADLNDVCQIVNALCELIQRISEQQLEFLSNDEIEAFSRTATAITLTEQLIALNQKDQHS